MRTTDDSFKIYLQVPLVYIHKTGLYLADQYNKGIIVQPITYIKLTIKLAFAMPGTQKTFKHRIFVTLQRTIFALNIGAPQNVYAKS